METETIGSSINKQVEKREKVDILERLNKYINGFLAVIAGCSLFAMIALVVGNAIARVFYAPFLGTAEIVGWLAALTAALAVGYTQRHKGHVNIDLLLDKFPQKIRFVIGSLINICSIIFFTIISYHLMVYAMDLKQDGRVSETLVLAYYPLVFMLAIGFAGLILALVIDLVSGIRKGQFK